MLFNSIEFLLFFPIVTFVYFIFPKKYRYLWLLASSYFFYMSWNINYAFLLFASTLITYTASIGIAWCGYREQKISSGGVKTGSGNVFLQEVLYAIC